MTTSERALLIVPVMPADGGNGLAMRAGLLLEGLARAFAVDVLVVPAFGGAGRPGTYATGLADRIDTLSPAPGSDAATEFVRALATSAGRDRADALHPLPALCQVVTGSTRERVADRAAEVAVVVVMRAYLAPALDHLLDRAERPAIVLDLDDLESDTQRELGHAEEAARFDRLERHYLPLVDTVLTCSDSDAHEVTRRHQVRRAEVVPNAVRLPVTVADPPDDAPYDLLFVGTLSYGPNAEAGRWLVDRVLPELGDARVAIVGHAPGNEVRRLAEDPRITVAADVDDVAPWYGDSRISAVPLFRGGGSSIKLLEGLAHGRPVVSTSVGARGLDWVEESEAVAVADSPGAFGAACRALLAAPDQARELGVRGRELVRDHASVEVIAPRIAELAVGLVDRQD